MVDHITKTGEKKTLHKTKRFFLKDHKRLIVLVNFKYEVNKSIYYNDHINTQKCSFFCN